MEEVIFVMPEVVQVFFKRLKYLTSINTVGQNYLFWSLQCFFSPWSKDWNRLLSVEPYYSAALEFPDTHACRRKCVSVCFMCAYVYVCVTEGIYLHLCVCACVSTLACVHSRCWCGSLPLLSPRGHTAGEDWMGGDVVCGDGEKGGCWGGCFRMKEVLCVCVYVSGEVPQRSRAQ